MFSILVDLFGIDNLEVVFIIGRYLRKTQKATKEEIEQYKIDYKNRIEYKKEKERQRGKINYAKKEKTKCICGSIIKDVRGHLKSQKHQKYLNTKNA